MTIVGSGELRLEPFPADPTRSIASEFGGDSPYALENYYRGGPLVADIPSNSGIPTAGTINMEDFYGAEAAATPIITVAEFRKTDVGTLEFRDWGWLSADVFDDHPARENGFGATTRTLIYTTFLRGIFVQTLHLPGNDKQIRGLDSFNVVLNGHHNEATFGFSEINVDLGGTLGDVVLRPTMADPGDGLFFSFQQLMDLSPTPAPITVLLWDLVGDRPELLGWNANDNIPCVFLPVP